MPFQFQFTIGDVFATVSLNRKTVPGRARIPLDGEEFLALERLVPIPVVGIGRGQLDRYLDFSVGRRCISHAIGHREHIETAGKSPSPRPLRQNSSTPVSWPPV